MIEMYDLSPAACVDRGIDFLDETMDDWDAKIILAELDLGMACSCVCGFSFKDQAAMSTRFIYRDSATYQVTPTGYDYAVLTYGVKFKLDWSRIPEQVMGRLQSDYPLSKEAQMWAIMFGFDYMNGFSSYEELQYLWVQAIARRQVERLAAKEREQEMQLVC